uniref:Uncharacterized protein n=1 Tax=Plectus sambesii TaxID=2011161 RepID=A0A914XA37_9BILA
MNGESPRRGFFSDFRPRSKSDCRKTPVQRRSPAIASVNEESEWTADATGHLPGISATMQHRGKSEQRQPLFVDTQLANRANVHDKRRSPVAQVVDFVKGRSRTQSSSIGSKTPEMKREKNRLLAPPRRKVSSPARIISAAGSAIHQRVMSGPNEGLFGSWRKQTSNEASKQAGACGRGGQADTTRIKWPIPRLTGRVARVDCCSVVASSALVSVLGDCLARATVAAATGGQLAAAACIIHYVCALDPIVPLILPLSWRDLVSRRVGMSSSTAVRQPSSTASITGLKLKWKSFDSDQPTLSNERKAYGPPHNPPLRSPVSKTVPNRYNRAIMIQTTHNQRSLDSGLDLNCSPLSSAFVREAAAAANFSNDLSTFFECGSDIGMDDDIEYC